MQNGDEASASIKLAGRALLVKMLITLEPRGVFGSNFAYLKVLLLLVSVVSSRLFLISILGQDLVLVVSVHVIVSMIMRM